MYVFYSPGSKGGDESGNMSAFLSGVPRDISGKLLPVTPGN